MDVVGMGVRGIPRSSGVSHVGWGWKSQSGQVTHKNQVVRTPHTPPRLYSQCAALYRGCPRASSSFNFSSNFCQGWDNTWGLYYITRLLNPTRITCIETFSGKLVFITNFFDLEIWRVGYFPKHLPGSWGCNTFTFSLLLGLVFLYILTCLKK